MLGVDVVFHLAAQSNVLGAEYDREYAVSTNVLGTISVLRTALEAGVRRVVFSSSREVYGDPDILPVPETAPVRPKNGYGASKAAGEAYCNAFQQAGLEIAVLRLANVYGPRDSDRVIPIFLRNSEREEPLVIYGGSQVVDFVWIADAVESLVRAATVPRVTEPINVGSGSGISVLDLARTILDITGSHSDLHMFPARSVETCGFVADTRRMQTQLGLGSSNGVAHHLAELFLSQRDRSCFMRTLADDERFRGQSARVLGISKNCW
jgi:nucleoside-diphosphate-sugar epimerase